MIKPRSHLRFFPLRGVLKRYSWEKAKGDFFAGFNVSLLDLPQAMAYALLAGFPVTFGIYASAIACILGPILASSRYVILGPTNATAVLVLSSFMVLEYTDSERMAALPVLVVMVGIFLILGAFLRLGGLTRYVSRTVVTGYITAAALLIIINQIDTVLGLPSVQAVTFFQVVSENAAHWELIRWESLLMVGITLLSYFAFKRFLPRLPSVAFVLLTSCVLAYLLKLGGVEVRMLEGMSMGVWPVAIPDFTFERVSHLGGAAIAIAFLSLLESSSIAKTLAARSGERVDLNQHMLSMGVANVGAAIGSGISVSGSITRSTLNCASGARTSISSIFSGLILVLAALVMGPVISYIPKPALAAIVVVVGVSLINPEHIRIFLRSTRADAFVFAVTFVSGLLFPLHVAIYMGAAASIILFLQKVSQPQLVEYYFTSTGELAQKVREQEVAIPEVSIVHIEGELFFGSTEIFLDQTRLIVESPNLRVIILKIRNANHLDASSAMAIADLIAFAKQKERTLLVCGGSRQVKHVFEESGAMTLLGEENFFKFSARNPNRCTADALKRAQEILGRDKANIILFTTRPSELEPKGEKEEHAELPS